MLTIKSALKSLSGDRRGVAAIEYALIACGISIVIVTVVNGVGSQVSTKFANVSSSLK